MKYNEKDVQAFVTTKVGQAIMQVNNPGLFQIEFEKWYQQRERKRNAGKTTGSLSDFMEAAI